MSAVNLRSAAGNTPFLYTPYYTRSLKDNAWTFTVRPGKQRNQRLFRKKCFHLSRHPPLPSQTFVGLLFPCWERFWRGIPYSTTHGGGSVSYYRIEDKIDDRKRWDLRYAHWQQLTPPLASAVSCGDAERSRCQQRFPWGHHQRARQLGQLVAFTTDAVHQPNFCPT